MAQKVAVSREFEARLRHAATGKVSLSTQQKMGTFSNKGRIRQRKERDGISKLTRVKVQVTVFKLREATHPRKK